MPRPKSDDPKTAVTLRLPASVVARWKAGGDDWRVRMEAALRDRPAPAVVAPVKAEQPKPAPKVVKTVEPDDTGKGYAVSYGPVRRPVGALLDKKRR